MLAIYLREEITSNSTHPMQMRDAVAKEWYNTRAMQAPQGKTVSLQARGLKTPEKRGPELSPSPMHRQKNQTMEDPKAYTLDGQGLEGKDKALTVTAVIVASCTDLLWMLKILNLQT